MRMVEGNKTESRVIKFKGQPVGHDCTYEGTDRYALHDYLFLPRRGFRSARTIELRQFEFCRITIGLDVSVPEGVDRDTVYEACAEFVHEHLKSEETAVGDGNYTPNISSDSLALLDQCKARMITLHYGLTLKAKKQFESEQVDVLNWEPVSDGEDLSAFLSVLSDEAGKKLDEQHNRIKSDGESTGL